MGINLHVINFPKWPMCSEQNEPTSRLAAPKRLSTAYPCSCGRSFTICNRTVVSNRATFDVYCSGPISACRFVETRSASHWVIGFTARADRHDAGL